MLAERQRIARDLHDQVIQQLFSTGLSLQGTVRGIADPHVRRRVSRAVGELDETVRQIRHSVFDLTSTESDAPDSLRRRMLDIVRNLTADSDVTATARISGSVDTHVPDDVANHATAVLREAVSNAVRHAHASSIIVTIEADTSLIIDVVDNGIGMPADTARSGLLNINHRATACGGMAAVVPGPDGGTRVTWRVPLPAS